MNNKSERSQCLENLKKYLRDANRISSVHDTELNSIIRSVVNSYSSLVVGSPPNQAYTLGQFALKRLLRFAHRLSTIEKKDEYLAKFTTFKNLTDFMKQGEYSQVIDGYNLEFSNDDWDKVENYFKNNADKTFCGRQEGMMYSYINTGEKIIRRGYELGLGAYGRIKSGEEQSEDGLISAIKRQYKRQYLSLSDQDKKTRLNGLRQVTFVFSKRIRIPKALSTSCLIFISLVDK